MLRPFDTYQHVDVLLATCNGSRFLHEQIESIMLQDYPHFRVLAHDDGSSDATLEILRYHAALFPDRFMLLEDGVLLSSACRNFFHLLARSTAELVTFADQDDVWLPGRISKLAAKIETNTAHPAGAYCDLTVVDQDLQTIAPSAWEMQGTPSWVSASVADLAPGNCVTGCAFMMNASARECVLARPRDCAVMHDHFSALCILLDGGILAPVTEPLVLYRQHGANQVGAVRMLTARKLFTDLPEHLWKLKSKYLQARQAGLRIGFPKFLLWAVLTTVRRKIDYLRNFDREEI